MDTIPITGLDELDAHLDELVQDAATPLNVKLFDEVELQLTGSNIPPLIVRFLPRLTNILKQYADDPTILASLAVKLLGPVNFMQVLSLATQDSLVQALESPAPAANILAMTAIHKAAANPASASVFAAMPQLIAAFIRRWLAAPQVEVGEKGGKVLGDLLDIDCELPIPPPPPSGTSGNELALRKSPGAGALWRTLFLNKEIYTLLLALCAGIHPDTSGDPHQLSLAQGRLLRVLPRLAALNFRAVSRSNIALPTAARFTNGHGGGQESAAGPRPGEGLLQFAALRMVDRSDVLLHLSVVDFFEGFLGLMRVTEYSAYKVDTIRGIVAEAISEDAELKEALLSLPKRTIEEEAEDLKRWLQEVMPGETVRVAVR
ncbi:hypothetical protein B0H67DRAFT_610632 [Lasiosphaeris hirsuta]|uniref:DNA mismatch repair protein HSM3 N-terminal domain-containing protein n=1 Tax=Lasiosphaeris hirsuta TaxID=260670 RepID=A0AA40DY65_9PEZI|nr:hypothetical protein B0H67DRAFT_610632 [Lasiosphaeris hirsuta]